MKVLQAGQTGKGILLETEGFVQYDSTKTNLLEDFNSNQPVGSPFKIKCCLQKAEVENKNGRWYSKSLLNREMLKYLKLVKEGNGVGEVNHPPEGNIDLNALGHRITDIWWEDNVMMGNLELIVSPGFIKHGIVSMPGDKIMVYMGMGIKIGISSRGMGSLKEVYGKTMVQDDFELICWDLVTSPSTPGAYLFPETKKSDNIKEDVIKNDTNIIKENKLLTNLNKFLG